VADATSAPTDEHTVEESTDAEPDLMFDAPLTRSSGQAVLHVDATGYVDLMGRLHDGGYLMCVDLTAVDFLTFEGDRRVPPTIEPERFEVVVNLLCHAQRSRIRVRAQVPEEDSAVPSVSSLYPGVDAMEREAYDMFGVAFTDHPDLTRILMPEDWIGHPLRKDYNSGRIPVQFKAPVNRPDAVEA